MYVFSFPRGSRLTDVSIVLITSKWSLVPKRIVQVTGPHSSDPGPSLLCSFSSFCRAALLMKRKVL